MTVLENARRNRQRIVDLASRYGIKDLRVFGSSMRGDAGPSSDLDLLVDVEPGRSYLDLVAFWQEVEALLGHRVDVVTDGGISPYLRDSVYGEARAL
jgi:predicted nucleotidyltransferase